MNLDIDACHRVLDARDARFDGLFFVGVSSTGIYCRPVCWARRVKRENRTFYATPAAAERAGFRPCLLCRPELAPGRSPVDACSRVAAAAVRRIEDGGLDETTLPRLAAEFGIGERQLRRAIQAEYGVTAIELAQTHRLLTAKRLLTDTDLPVGEVAFASGFKSLRRFNDLFQTRYRLKPTDLRRRRRAHPGSDSVTFEIAYRPPYDWAAMLAFLDSRGAAGVEFVEGNRYLRTLAVGDRRGWVAAEPNPKKPTLRVEMSASLASKMPTVVRRLRRLFDTEAEPEAIAACLGGLADRKPGLRLPGSVDGFEIAVRAIVGQQVSVRAATTVAGRLATAFGEPIETPFENLTRLSPTASALADAGESAIASLGIVGARARAIVCLAGAVGGGSLKLGASADPESTIRQIEAMPGFGSWTAHYVGMRALGWPDAFPHTDLGLRKALREDDPKCVLRMAERWRPWRAYAAMHLWNSI